MKKDVSFHEQRHVIEAFSEIASQYENKMDSELNLFWGWTYQELIGALLDALPDLHSKSILDLATGKLVIPKAILAENPAVEKIIGLDITYRMLQLGKSNMIENSPIKLLCASALQIPLKDESFNLVTCALATHHMNVKQLLREIERVLVYEGDLLIVDVGASKTWMNPVIQFIIKTLAFLYFLVKEGASRAWAEASALPNIRTADDWQEELQIAGLSGVQIIKLKSRRLWIPDPIFIYAKKEHEK